MEMVEISEHWKWWRNRIEIDFGQMITVHHCAGTKVSCTSHSSLDW